jgi:hypothetical protein
MDDQQAEEDRHSENIVEDWLNQTIGQEGIRSEKKTALDQAVELLGKLRKIVELLTKVSDANERSEGGQNCVTPGGERRERGCCEDIDGGWLVGGSER